MSLTGTGLGRIGIDKTGPARKNPYFFTLVIVGPAEIDGADIWCGVFVEGYKGN
ncbi:hypothetical protein RHMOL_Rhmol02G0073100 [Rhododendron molle]|uniref:Uncharacterized protein n=1 Tax=Rhododendron molle TaxID=49168 RepID=A0ACC0PQ44_RHOML|nr:hypothetical protein RHMOL_Rhmol02G0073100 [Rhododendron molle]